MTPEGRVKLAVDKVLVGAKAYKHKPVMNGMGAPALDYHVCHRGIYAAIETKAGLANIPTVRQVRTMKEVARAGGAVFLISGENSDDMAQLQEWLLNPVPGFISRSAGIFMNMKGLGDDTTCND